MYIYSVTKKTLNQEIKEGFMFKFISYCAFLMPKTVGVQGVG